jgi:16S rRNA (adenine1518-N6/adenine1519-N6)-dimethyltransferase
LFPDITVVEADARTFPFESLGANLVVYGNVPYVYSTEILFNLIRSATQIDRVILLLQREFVERMAAKPGGKTYGILSVMVQLWADVEMGSIIGGGSFHPPTKVESRLVLLRFHRTPRYQVKNYELLRSVVRAAFSQRRRMITNSLRSLGYGTPEQIRTALERSGIPITDRAERVPIEKFVRLAEEVATFAPALTESSNPFPTAPISEIDSFDEAEGKVREEKIDETNR